MKKIIAIALCLSTLIGVAQTNMTGNGGRLTNAGTQTVTISPTLFNEQVSFQVKIVKDSGTVAGYAYLQASNDQTNWHTVTDSLTLTNTATNSKIFVLTYNPALYYRIYAEGTGTMEAKLYGYYWAASGGPKHAVTNMLQAYGSTSDTITNTATGYVGYTVSGYYRKLSIQCIVTKISGTVAGTVTLQGSNDGTNYVTVSSSYADATSLSCTNQATNKKLFTITGSPYKYYRLSYTGSGTMSATIKGYLVANK